MGHSALVDQLLLEIERDAVRPHRYARKTFVGSSAPLMRLTLAAVAVLIISIVLG